MGTNYIDTKIAVLGGGPAGYVAAIRAAQMGNSVALVEKDELGGVCLNRGCIPTKALLKTSDTISSYKKLKEYGIEGSISDINWCVSNIRKNHIVKSLRMGLENLLPLRGITVCRGVGTVKSPSQVQVETDDGQTIINCERMIIATGSRPFIPGIKGIGSKGVITSNEALELAHIPKSIVIIGAGAIGLEFAAMLNAAGSKVTVIEMKDRVLPYEDSEVSSELAKIMKRQGIAFKLSSTVREISEMDAVLKVTASEENRLTEIQCEKVLVAVGRKLNSDSDDIRHLGLETRNGAIAVNESMETSVKGIYAAGDITGGRLLAHLSFAEGKAAAENACGYNTRVNYNAVPSCVYTNPEVASVGMNEEDASRLGIDVKVGRFYFRNNGRSLTLGERDGFVKILVNAETGIIIGGQIIGCDASELISEVTLSILLNARAETVADMIHPHPTLSEAVWEACSDAIGRSIHGI